MAPVRCSKIPLFKTSDLPTFGFGVTHGFAQQRIPVKSRKPLLLDNFISSPDQTLDSMGNQERGSPGGPSFQGSPTSQHLV
mmetsp:Transcript_26535/g.47841  ORF Transcript_26535/g.47841 Transcript_26535/m.47841 type:complete len:81 (+) Transcript_26535:144-386(+)